MHWKIEDIMSFGNNFSIANQYLSCDISPQIFGPIPMVKIIDATL